MAKEEKEGKHNRLIQYGKYTAVFFSAGALAYFLWHHFNKTMPAIPPNVANIYGLPVSDPSTPSSVKNATGKTNGEGPAGIGIGEVAVIEKNCHNCGHDAPKKKRMVQETIWTING